jgi:hypothetical protein
VDSREFDKISQNCPYRKAGVCIAIYHFGDGSYRWCSAKVCDFWVWRNQQISVKKEKI